MRRALARKAVYRPLVRRPVHPHVGDRRRPLRQLLVAVEVVTESPARQEIALEVLHTRLDLPLRLGGRYARHSRGSKPQKSANALNVVFHRTPSAPRGTHTVRGRS